MNLGSFFKKIQSKFNKLDQLDSPDNVPNAKIIDESEKMIPLLFPIGHFYSPIIDPDDLRARESRIWARVDEMPGIALNLNVQLSILKELAPYISDLNWPIEKPNDPTCYYYQNDQYPILDAEFLHAIVRHSCPRKIIEVGSGWSSLIIAEVNRKYFHHSMEFICIEPFPRQFLLDGVEGITKLMQEKVEGVLNYLFSKSLMTATYYLSTLLILQRLEVM
jgi:hypothetical protein